jgi:leucyl aminopeptidase
MLEDPARLTSGAYRRSPRRTPSEVDIVLPQMLVSATTQPGRACDADTIVAGLFEDEQLSGDVSGALTDLVSSGEARGSFEALAVAHAEGKRWIVAGLGAREKFTPERARVVAAAVHGRAREISTRALCWQTPETDSTSGENGEPGDSGARPRDFVGALVEGTILAAYRFERHKSAPAKTPSGAPRELERLIISAPSAADGLEQVVEQAAIVAEAANAARDLQNRPANDLTPSALAEHARSLAREIGSLSVEVEQRDGILGLGMGAFAAVAQGSEQEPALIVLRYEHPDAEGPLLGYVGKAVTFDSGGISLKPGAKMSEMKFDMSGGAAVIEAVAAIARLNLPVRLVAVIGATENLPSGRAVKPGDIVTAANGKTIEVNNTDAEGRLVLADCLCHVVSLGAERIVDLATLTGAVIIALGSTHAGLITNDDALAEKLTQAGEQTGEILWRLPLHAEYDKLIEGRYGDLNNAPEDRKAGTIVGAAFLSHFVGDVPWAHLDIAGSAWDLGRAYAPKSASGYGVRLLVELARSYVVS